MLEFVRANWLAITFGIAIGIAVAAYAIGRRRARKQGLDDIYPMF